MSAVRSGRLRLLEEIDDLLWRLDAKMGDAGVPETDKLRTLLHYAWQEGRLQLDHAQQATPEELH